MLIASTNTGTLNLQLAACKDWVGILYLLFGYGIYLSGKLLYCYRIAVQRGFNYVSFCVNAVFSNGNAVIKR